MRHETRRPSPLARARTRTRRVIARSTGAFTAALLAAALACGGESSGAPSGLPEPALDVTGVMPSEGDVQGGTYVAVMGSGFREGASVAIGGAAATSVRVVSGRWLTAVAPPGRAAGVVGVAVTNPDGRRVERPQGFRYVSIDERGPSPWDY
jgi:hypothetical protein